MRIKNTVVEIRLKRVKQIVFQRRSETIDYIVAVQKVYNIQSLSLRISACMQVVSCFVHMESRRSVLSDFSNNGELGAQNSNIYLFYCFVRTLNIVVQSILTLCKNT